MSIGEAGIDAFARDAAAHMVKTSKFQPAKEADPGPGRYGYTSDGVPLHYDPSIPAGTTIKSTARKFASTKAGTRTRRTDADGVLRWYDGYGEEVPEPKAKMTYGTYQRPPAAIIPNSTTKPICATNIDPLGRNLEGTPEQMRQEAKRHGFEIKEGPGST